MAVFRYAANESGTGRLLRGELTADSAAQVRQTLRRMGLLPASVTPLVGREREEHTRGLSRLAQRWRRRRVRGAVAELYESLAALLSAGVAVTPALELLACGASGRRRGGVRTVCRQLADEVRQGRGLAESMAAQPRWFGSVDGALVRSAERSGELERAFVHLAEHHARSGAVAARLAGALAYPLLLLLFGFAVVVFLTTTTLPQLAGVLDESGVSVPAPTRALLGFGAALRSSGYAAVPGGLLVIALLGAALGSDRTARLRVSIPVLGRVLVRSQLGAASTLLARLLQAGLPLGECLGLVQPTVPNAAVRGVFASLSEHLARGSGRISEARGLREIDPVFARVLEVGEQSGEFDGTLQRIGERYLASSRRLVDRLAALLEPAVILLLAALIGFVVYAAVVPMLRVSQSL